MTKNKLHPRNRHQDRYDFALLTQAIPSLKKCIVKNKFNGEDTIDFSDSESVKLLNKAILKSIYKINFWDIPKDYLCPPIPGRADYIHYAADLLKMPFLNEQIKVLDIGTGANCVYPLLGNSEYGWQFVGSDIDKNSIVSAENIVLENKLQNFISLRLQEDQTKIFSGVILPADKFDLTICNPPFYASREEAVESSGRKNKNLGLRPERNFGGQGNELWTEGGESLFVKKMVLESLQYKNQCTWFSTLISSKDNLSGVYGELKRIGALEIKTFEMHQGQKISRFVAWTFLGSKK
jgi:23S rRNA (adenine1618-N6)-methyltransferase